MHWQRWVRVKRAEDEKNRKRKNEQTNGDVVFIAMIWSCGTKTCGSREGYAAPRFSQNGLIYRYIIYVSKLI